MPRLTKEQRKEYTDRVHAAAVEQGGGCSDAEVYSAKKANFWCKEGHEFQSNPANVTRPKKPSWCPYCAGNARLTLQYFEQYADIRGGRCLSTEYLNNKTHLKFQCRREHVFELEARTVTWQRSWCKQCQFADLEDVDVYCEERGGRCLTRDYINNYSTIWIECAQGHRWRTARKHILDGRWCWACHLDNRSRH